MDTGITKRSELFVGGGIVAGPPTETEAYAAKQKKMDAIIIQEENNVNRLYDLLMGFRGVSTRLGLDAEHTSGNGEAFTRTTLQAKSDDLKKQIEGLKGINRLSYHQMATFDLLKTFESLLKEFEDLA